ncbi:hypothetical protein XENOCAPTIV_000513 [Xenoophorus captivus]|uniref:Uncharacterized protein n=1 Tax=Xenoophorus captivus TaxID=1517983 RepID=A0ABV0RMY9_9TELE
MAGAALQVLLVEANQEGFLRSRNQEIWIPLMTVSWIPCSCVFCSGELLGTTPNCSCRESPFLSCFQPRHSEHHSNTKPLLTCLSNLSTTRSAGALLLKCITQRQAVLRTSVLLLLTLPLWENLPLPTNHHHCLQ